MRQYLSVLTVSLVLSVSANNAEAANAQQDPNHPAYVYVSNPAGEVTACSAITTVDQLLPNMDLPPAAPGHEWAFFIRGMVYRGGCTLGSIALINAPLGIGTQDNPLCLCEAPGGIVIAILMDYV